jgi:hypothetical protein
MLGIWVVCTNVWFCSAIFRMGNYWGLKIIDFVTKYVCQWNMPREGHDSQMKGGPKYSDLIECQLIK